MKLLQQIATLVAEAITRLYRVVDTHKTDYTNPHRVTKVQVGLDRVDNTADRDKPLSTIQQDSLGALNGRISEHTGNSKIHKTSEQIRGEITDADIPASIARNAEMEARLAGKIDKENGKGLSSNDYTDGEKAKLGRMGTYVTDFASDPQSLPDGKFQVCLKAYRYNPNTGETLTNGIAINEAGEVTNGLLSVEGYHQLEGLKRDGVTMDVGGTPSPTWHIGKPSGVIAKSSGGTLEVRTAADAGYADMVVNGLTVKGDMVVDGESFVVNSQTVETTDNLILLNKGEVGAGVTKGVAGLEIDRGTADRYKIVFDESDDRFKAGAGTDLWPILLRDKDGDLTGDSMLVWDAAAKRAKTGKNLDAELAGYLPLAGGTMASGAMIRVSGSASGVVRDGSNEGFVITPDEVAVGGYSSGISVMTDGSRTDIVHHVPNHKYKMWDEGNDGSGSGLDADLLDGRQGAEYALKSEIPSGLALGETASTAYRGDRGKVAYDYSQGKRSKADLDAALQGEINNKINDLDPILRGCLRINPNKLGYSEGIRIASFGNWSDILLAVDPNASNGFIDGQWLIGRNPNAGFTICQSGTETTSAIPSTGLGISPNNGGLYFNNNSVVLNNDPRLSDARPANGGNADHLIYQGNLPAISGTTTPSHSGLALYGVYVNDYPCAYGNLLQVNGQGHSELLLGWTGGTDIGNVYYRSKRDNGPTAWSNWSRLVFENELSGYLPLSGGTLHSQVGHVLILNSTSDTCYMVFNKSNVDKGYVGLPTSDNNMYLVSYEGHVILGPADGFKALYRNNEIATVNQIPTSLPANGGNADTVDGYHAAALIPNVFNQSTAPTSGMKKGDIWVKP